MKLNKFKLSSLPLLVLFSFVLILGATILSACGGKKHSVREMRDAKTPYIPKPAEKAMVQPLFLQNKKPNIGLPKNVVGSEGGFIVTEQVEYKNPELHSDIFETNTLDPNKTYGLNEVEVVARSRFTPERNGKINVDFIVKVPKELIDRNWMIKMQPIILHRDSIQKLDYLVIKGTQFALKQKLDYQAYEDYLNSIVAKEDYDSVFLDHRAIQQDIIDRQNFYYSEYHNDWSLHKEYEDWLEKEKEKLAQEKALLKGQIAEMQYNYKRMLLTHAIRDIARGVDTTGLAVSYNMQFLRKASGMQKRLNALEMGDIKIPKKYKEVHAMRTGSKDIENLSMTSQDTLDIAKVRYKFDEIIENEMKEARKEIVKKEMIPFPYDTQARIDSTVDIGKGFAYYYSQELPVTPGLRSVNIAMQSQVVAIDASKFNLRRSDTLSYFISSIAQLVDTTLLHKQTVRNRNATHRQTANFKYRPNTWRFDIKYKDNASEMAKLTKDYDTFQASKGFAVDSMLIQQSTSIEGEYARNAELSMRRVEDLKKYMVASTPMGRQGGDQFFTTRYIGEDWNGLVRLLRSSSNIPNATSIIDMLGNAANPDETKQEIMSMYKEDYQTMKETIFPQLDKVDVLFYIHRTDMTDDRETITVDPEYIKGVRLLQNRQYSEAMEVLANYPDYNAAVALAALGYNSKAYEVLVKQKPTGNTEYLSAIVAWRLSQEEVAINHLLKSIELDPTKVYRLGLDPDINDMVQKHKLQNRINQIGK